MGIERVFLEKLAILPFIAPEYHGTFFHHQKKVYETKTRQTCELQMKRKDGALFWAQLVSTAIQDPDDHFDRQLTAIIDISERRQYEIKQREMEQAIFKSQKMESIGTLAGGIAHDFNNILTSILGNLSMARMQARPEDEIFDLLSEAEIASRRAQMLSKQLLTFAKGGLPVKETTSIRDILKVSPIVLRGSKSDCEFLIADNLLIAEVDIGQISQAITNLVINANQAMPEGGIIRLAAENLTIDDRHGLAPQAWKIHQDIH